MTLFVTKRETPIGEVVAYRNERGLVSMGFAEGMKEAQDGMRIRTPPLAQRSTNISLARQARSTRSWSTFREPRCNDASGVVCAASRPARRGLTESWVQRSERLAVSSATQWPPTPCAWRFPAIV